MIAKKKKLNVGVGFVTGRKNFKSVLKAYVDNWNESSVVDIKKYTLHLFVAYDLAYKSTKLSDYTISEESILDTVDSAFYIGESSIATEVQHLIENKVISLEEADLLFGDGYAKKRNAVLYFALKNKMDYLIFLDDDEYPIALLNVNDSIVWKGQDVLGVHIDNIKDCDMTHGHHCGFISPIPYVEYNNKLSENEFQRFIEAISNDIIDWKTIKEKMLHGGVTYADLNIIESKKIEIVKERNGLKFVSGANLGFNLKDTDKLFPFYNPPSARGEDTFLSTCLSECTIRKIPCYTFHDGFSNYHILLHGALPNKIKTMNAESSLIAKRFLQASLGWIRYKPLMLYITNRENYKSEIDKIKINLNRVLPNICKYFRNDKFKEMLNELAFFDTQVEAHYRDFQNTKRAWIKLVHFLEKGNVKPSTNHLD